MQVLLFEQTHMAEQSHLGEMAVETRLEVKADYVFTFKQLQMHHIGVTEVAPLACTALRHHQYVLLVSIHHEGTHRAVAHI